MKVFIVFCHPGKESFTHKVLDQYQQGLIAAGHTIIVSDLYAMKFSSDMTVEEYQRETYYRADLPLAEDVKAEQQKIQDADCIVFLYPVFWTEAPAKLVGWFDRVWTSGFAYNPNPSMKKLDRAICIACAGKSMQALLETGEKHAMETVMLGDRIRDRASHSELIIFDSVTHWNEELRKTMEARHLLEAYRLGREL